MKYTSKHIYILLLLLILGFGKIEGQIINGISYVGPEHREDISESFKEIKNTNAGWVAIIPEAIINRNSMELRKNNENHWWGGTIEGVRQSIVSARSAGLSILLKPQVILDNVHYIDTEGSQKIELINFGKIVVDDKSNRATWRGDLELNETYWKIWEDSYTKYILNLAQIAAEYELELFCIGTELKSSTKNRPQFWYNLIKDVRNIYSGPITYSANWDEYEYIPFWEDLDIIGVNAYFPLSKKKEPSVKHLKKKWNRVKKSIRKVSKRYSKSVLLTEFGYRNVPFAGKEPWTHDQKGSEINMKSQANLYEAFFQSFWNEKWIIGGFAWNWVENQPISLNTDFSFRGKPAERILRKWFKSANTIEVME